MMINVKISTRNFCWCKFPQTKLLNKKNRCLALSLLFGCFLITTNAIAQKGSYDLDIRAGVSDNLNHGIEFLSKSSYSANIICSNTCDGGTFQASVVSVGKNNVIFKFSGPYKGCKRKKCDGDYFTARLNVPFNKGYCQITFGYTWSWLGVVKNVKRTECNGPYRIQPHGPGLRIVKK